MTLPKIGKPATRALNSQGIYIRRCITIYKVISNGDAWRWS